jgi:hypothetical protein
MLLRNLYIGMAAHAPFAMPFLWSGNRFAATLSRPGRSKYCEVALSVRRERGDGPFFACIYAIPSRSGHFSSGPLSGRKTSHDLTQWSCDLSPNLCVLLRFHWNSDPGEYRLSDLPREHHRANGGPERVCGEVGHARVPCRNE